MKTLTIPSCIALAAFASSIGCGDDGGGGPAKSSGVDSGKTLSALTDADAQKICSWQLSLNDAELSTEQQCTIDAIDETIFDGDEAACEAKRASCIENPPSVEDEDENESGGDGCGAATAPKTTCAATVAEYEDCISALAEDSRNAIENASCDFDARTDQAYPAACEALDEKCPGLGLAFEI